MTHHPNRRLPSVHDVLDSAPLRELQTRHGHAVVVAAVRAVLAELRNGRSVELLNGETTAEIIGRSVVQRLQQELRPKLRPVINATGIVLHTNLGRAPLAEAAARAAYEAGR